MDPDDTLWVVQGPHGRMPILADDEESAVRRYFDKNADKEVIIPVGDTEE